MNKKRRKVSTDDLRGMISDPRPMPNLDDLDLSEVWWPLVDNYFLEQQHRKITRLRREKILLRAALQDTMQEVVKAGNFGNSKDGVRWYPYMPRQHRILKLTEDK